MESPYGKLAWVELLKPNYTSESIKQCFYLILLGVAIGVVLGNIRELLWHRIMNNENISKMIKRIDISINGVNYRSEEGEHGLF